MAKLSNLNHFVYAPQVQDIGRSRFPRRFNHKTSMISGQIVPILFDEVLPHDTWKIDLAALVRSVTPAVPVMDSAYIDFYAFFTPMRLLTKSSKDWQEICGENTGGYWAQTSEVTLETSGNLLKTSQSVSPGTCTIEPQSVLNYLGYPILNHDSSSQNQVDFYFPAMRNINLIYNEYFRDQNTQPPIDFTWDVAQINKDNKGGENYPYWSNKFPDYFTTALPSPQKSPSVLIPLFDGDAPVYSGSSTSGRTEKNTGGTKWVRSDGLPWNTAAANNGVALTIHPYSLRKAPITGPFDTQGDVFDSPSAAGPTVRVDNLWADLASASGATVNQLRFAFALQRLFEKDARGGSRYIETLRNHFGTAPLDATLQRPQYLGGKRIPLSMLQVLQTSETTENSPLGSTGAFSNSSMNAGICPLHSFTEFGYITVVATIRTQQTYSQGLPRMFSRNRRFDFYWPVFANLGEQAVLKKEMYIPYTGGTSSADQNENVFGYQEAWAEYRFHPNQVSGYLAPNAKDPILTAWTYALNLSDYPVLNQEFMKQPRSQVDDTLAIADSTYQFICDFEFDCDVVRPMPLYSIPGLIDHH